MRSIIAEVVVGARAELAALRRAAPAPSRRRQQAEASRAAVSHAARLRDQLELDGRGDSGSGALDAALFDRSVDDARATAVADGDDGPLLRLCEVRKKMERDNTRGTMPSTALETKPLEIR